MNFTITEQAILDWFSKNTQSSSLRSNLFKVQPSACESTESGFFTDLCIPGEPAPLGEQVAFTGCGLFAPELSPYADCILHTISCVPVCIEVFSVGEGHPLQVSSFHIKGINDNIIDLRPSTSA